MLFIWINLALEEKFMKMIAAVIKHFKLDDVKDALSQAGIQGMTVTEVKGFGNEQTRPDSYLFLPKTKVEVYCADDALDPLIETICRVCHTGRLGDGKIAVFNIEELVRIRTGNRGEVAV